MRADVPIRRYVLRSGGTKSCRCGLIFFCLAARHDFQGIIGQRPLQPLRLVPAERPERSDDADRGQADLTYRSRCALNGHQRPRQRDGRLQCAKCCRHQASLIVAHEVTNVGSDRSQLSHMSERARAAIGSEAIEAVADRGYYSGEEILACEQAGITVYLPKPMTSGINARGRFGKQDFVYVAEDDVYRCPAGEQLTYRYTNEEDGKTLRRYWTSTNRYSAVV